MKTSLGLIETRGLAAAIRAADAACKAASVELVGYKKVGGGLVTLCLLGEISALKMAIEHCTTSLPLANEILAKRVIARPEPCLLTLLNTGHNTPSPKAIIEPALSAAATPLNLVIKDEATLPPTAKTKKQPSSNNKKRPGHR